MDPTTILPSENELKNKANNRDEEKPLESSKPSHGMAFFVEVSEFFSHDISCRFLRIKQKCYGNASDGFGAYFFIGMQHISDGLIDFKLLHFGKLEIPPPHVVFLARLCSLLHFLAQIS